MSPFRTSEAYSLGIRRLRRGFKLADLCVVMAALGILVAVLPALRQNAREQNNRIKCASNLRLISMHAFMYANNDTRGGQKFPRAYYNPGAPLDKSLTGGTAAVPTAKTFETTRPERPVGANNTMASFYLLLKATDLTSDAFVCPSTETTRAYIGADVQQYSNWPSPYAAYNSYSYNCPFPTRNAVSGGWKFDTTLGPDHPLAADINPGAGAASVAYNAPAKEMQPANSPNHWFDGQQVAYCDGHVEWQTSPFAGVQRPKDPFRDNIYVAYAGTSPGSGKGGTPWGQPVDAQDAVLLPTAQDSPGAAIAARVAGAVPPLEVKNIVILAIGVLIMVGGSGFTYWKARKEPEVAAGPQPVAALPAPAGGPQTYPQYPPPGVG